MIKIREGLTRGLKTFYYVWSGDKPPEDPSSLKPVKTGVSPWINYVWWNSPTPGVPGEFFAILWVGFIEVDKSGYYRFYVVTDDGSRVWINDELIIDAWRDQPPTAYISKPIYLKKGFHRLKYYFYNRFSFAEAVLGWIDADGSSSVVPKEKLYYCIGNEVFFTNLPEGYTVEILPTESEVRRCTSAKGICKLVLIDNEIPLEAYVRIIDPSGRTIYESKEKTIIWGGDEFKVMRIEKGPVA